MTDNKIHVVLAVYDPRGTYSRHAGVVLASMFSNTKSPVCVHILHDETLSDDNRIKLIGLTEQFGQELNFVNVGEYIEKFRADMDVDKLTSGFSRGSLYRLFIQDVLPIDRVIYLDCDVVVKLDIKELWDTELGGCEVGAVLDCLARGDYSERRSFFFRYIGIDWKKYFNSGVILFDLKKIRGAFDICAEISEFFLRYPDTLAPDQDLLNKIFQKNARVLDLKFNYHGKGIEYSNTDGKLWHFLGRKPWDLAAGLPSDALYWQYFAKTPWCHDLASDMTEAWAKSRYTHVHSRDCLKLLWRNFKESFSSRKVTPFYKVIVIWHDIKYRLRKKFGILN